MGTDPDRLSTQLSAALTAPEASMHTPRPHVLGRRHVWCDRWDGAVLAVVWRDIDGP
jgi:hypothetical protein